MGTLIIAFLLVTCIKLLLIPAYRSTDFEVHRNWLAITHNLPLSKWYYEDSSEWTLDYPPLFGWFEYFLSQFAVLFDANMLTLDNYYYASFGTILFQRLTVIVTDGIFAYGVHRCCHILSENKRLEAVSMVLLIANIGLLFVDHIHFQYNGIMYGLLLLSVAAIAKASYVLGAFWFLILLNMKHLFLYMAPAYFVYLLRNYCFDGRWTFDLKRFSVKNTLRLGTTVIAVFLVTFLPFLHQLSQVLSRMFPFKRGLCHAYWAPNVWALYNVADKAAVVAGRRLGLKIDADVAAMTGGLVREFSHGVLPDVKPLATMLLTVCAMLPALFKLWVAGPRPVHFVRCLVICSLTSFLFGWHVHEKAILMSVVPLSIVSVLEYEDARLFTLLSTVGHYSLFPLLFTDSMQPIKVLMYIIYSLWTFYNLSRVHSRHSRHKYCLPLLNAFESIYTLGFVPLFLYETVIHNLLGLTDKLPYLPLMLTSVYCALGVTYCWIKYYVHFMNRCKIPFANKGKRKN